MFWLPPSDHSTHVALTWEDGKIEPKIYVNGFEQDLETIRRMELEEQDNE